MTLKQILSGMVLMLNVLCPSLLWAQGGTVASLLLDPAESTLPPVGERLTFNVVAHDVTDFYGFQLDLTFDKDVLQVVEGGVHEGDFLSSDGVNTHFGIQQGIFNEFGFVAGVSVTRLRTVDYQVNPDTGQLEEVTRPESLQGVSGGGVILQVEFEVLDDTRENIVGLKEVKLASTSGAIPTTTSDARLLPRPLGDTTPPSAITDLVGPEGWVSDPAVLIQWTAATDAESEITGYQYTVDDLLDNQLQGAWIEAGNLTEITLPLTDGSHEIWIRALNSAGLTGPATSVTVRVDASPPDVVSQAVDSGEQTRDEITIQWRPVTDLSDIAGYAVQLSSATEFDSILQESETVDTVASFSADLLSNGTAYYARVRARNGAGLWQEQWSAPTDGILVDFQPPLPPANLHSPTHQIGVPSKTGVIEVVWDAASDLESGLAGYALTWDSSPTTKVTGPATIGAEVVQAFSPDQTPPTVVYFHLAPMDQVGNVAPTVHLGPFPVEQESVELPTLEGLTIEPAAGGRLLLRWVASSLPGVASYAIYGDNGAGTVGDIPLTVVPHPFNLWLSSPLAGEFDYTFLLRALDATGKPLAVSEATPPTAVDAEPPSPPTQPTATQLEDGRVRLSWRPSPSTDVISYFIYGDNGTGTVDYTTPLAIVIHPQTVWISSPLPQGVGRSFGIRAADATGNVELNTSVQAIVTPTVPDQPAPPSNLAAQVLQGGQVRLAWLASPDLNVTEYRIYSDNALGNIDYTAPVAIVTHPTIVWTATSLISGQSYQFGVRAVSGRGVEETNLDVTVSVVPDGTPPRPVTGLQALAQPDQRMELSWMGSGSNDVVVYYIYWDGGLGVIDYGQPIGSVQAPGNRWQSLPLLEGHNYLFAVRAADQIGNIEQNRDVWIRYATEQINRPPNVAETTVPPGSVTSNVEVGYVLEDPDLDTLSLSLSYSMDGGIRWQEATLAGGSATEIRSSQYRGTLIWDSRRDIPSTSGISVRLQLTVADAAAQAVFQTVPFRVVNLIADYDEDQDVDFDDLGLFIEALATNDTRRDIGPVTGLTPDLMPLPDGKLDFEDIAAFVLMWNWSAAQKPQVAPLSLVALDALPLANPDFASLLVEAPGEFALRLVLASPDARSERLVLAYAPEHLALRDISLETANAGDGWLLLRHRDPRAGLIDLQLARLPGHADNLKATVVLRFAQHLEGTPDLALYRKVAGWGVGEIAESAERLPLPVAPTHFQALPSFPNPANPEVWIPYVLAEPGQVLIDIMGVDGGAVRQLDLGMQRAGEYLSTSLAAHWDGRNDGGEQAASGLYFYRIHSGHWTATRRLIIVR